MGSIENTNSGSCLSFHDKTKTTIERRKKMNETEIRSIVENGKFFDELEEETFINYADDIFNFTLRERPDLLEKWLESYDNKCDEVNPHRDDFEYAQNMRAERYEDWANIIYGKHTNTARYFYTAAGEYYEYYWDLLWLKSNIVEKYKDLDPKYISQCAKLAGYEAEDQDVDSYNEEDFEDLPIELVLEDGMEISQVCDLLNEHMRAFSDKSKG